MPQETASPTETPAVYDLKGLNCPLPVLKARKRLADMQPGGLLWLETTDPLAVIDIPAFCTDSGHRLVETTAISGGHRFLVERGG
ncbi:sulfurtransferase TusA family protein [Mesorhizobium sp. NPDC059054]|uniref:sulfurtransferase TusA family protein n=1 Tax=Mesorhizobium sp. NPDC059054 TaxID=3346711 RepID=UPI00369C76DA